MISSNTFNQYLGATFCVHGSLQPVSFHYLASNQCYVTDEMCSSKQNKSCCNKRRACGHTVTSELLALV